MSFHYCKKCADMRGFKPKPHFRVVVPVPRRVLKEGFANFEIARLYARTESPTARVEEHDGPEICAVCGTER